MKKPTIKLKRAGSAAAAAAIARETITAVYPHYYPAGAVDFFLALHDEEKIKEAISKEEIYLAMLQDIVVGTGSIRRNEICRLFILPEHQKKGYGSQLMDLLEEKLFENHEMIHIDASFPAESMYLKRGYDIASYEQIKTENGDFLCYHTMEKRKGHIRKIAGKTKNEREEQETQ